MAKKSSKVTRLSEDRKWKIRNAADTLLEAEKVRKDKKLLSDAKRELKVRKKEIQAVIKRKK